MSFFYIQNHNRYNFITEVSAILFKYLLFSQVHVLEFGLRFVLLTFHLQSHEISFAMFSFTLFILVNALTFRSFGVFFTTHIFGDMALQLPLQSSKLMMNGLYLSSTDF